MKKLFVVFMGLLLIPVLASCGKKVGLIVYAPTEYMDMGLIKKFEKKYDIDVKFQTFGSNEEAHRMIAEENFDVVIPSDYMIEQLAKEDLLIELDYEKISNFSKNKLVNDLASNLETLKNAENGFNLLKYSVPYFWGNVGLVYDTRDVKLSDLQAADWAILKSNSYDIAFYNSARDAFMIALKELGYSANTTTSKELDEAASWLKTTVDDGKKGGKFSIVTDEILDYMMFEDETKYDIAVAYSGDAAWLLSENDSLEFYLPASGTNTFIDGFAISQKAKHVDMAYDFINYMWQDSSLVANTEEVGYTSPCQSVYDQMMTTDGTYYDNNAYLVRFNAVDEMFRYNPSTIEKINEEWLEAIA